MAYLVDMDGNQTPIDLHPQKQPEPEQQQKDQPVEDVSSSTTILGMKRDTAIIAGAIGLALLLAVGYYLYSNRKKRPSARFEFY